MNLDTSRNDKFELASAIGVSPYPSKWTKLNHLMLRRVATQLFLDGSIGPTLRGAGTHLFSKFGAEPQYLHPYVSLRSYTPKQYNMIMETSGLGTILSLSKADFMMHIRNRIACGLPVDALLYAQIVRPNLKFDISRVEMLNHDDAFVLGQQYANRLAPSVVVPVAPVAPVAPALAPAKMENKVKVELNLSPALGHPFADKSSESRDALTTLIGSPADVEELNIQVMYLNDTIQNLVAEQKTTQAMLAQLLENGGAVPESLRPQALAATKVVKEKGRHSVLVVGMWPRQYESLRLGFDPEFFEHFHIDYVASDKVRKHALQSSDGYDLIAVNTAAINHVIEDVVRANCKAITRYSGGVSAFRTVLIGKANSGDFGEVVRKNILNWVN